MRFVSFLIKPASSACNLRCRYCFYADEAGRRAVKDMGRMSPETAERLLTQGYALAEPGGTVSFAFQGGEPTLAGLDFFQRFVRRAKALCPPGVRTQFSLQTNGLLLDEPWAVFLKENGFLVGLSLDGYGELHDLYRTDAAGRGSFAPARRAARLLQKHGVAVNALCVVTAQCARHPERAYSALKGLGFGFLQFIPCLDPLGEARGGEAFSLTPAAYGGFLCRLFDLWFRDWQSGHYHSVRLFDDYVNMLLGGPASTCATCGSCGSYFVAEGDGGIYPCDFYALDGWKLGDLATGSLADMAAGERAAAFLAESREKPAACRDCRWRPLCNGGCRRDWVAGAAGPENYFCPAFRQFFSHAISRLELIASAERRQAGR